MIRLLKTQYDSFVRETTPATNYRDSKFLSMRTDTGEHRRAFLYFSMPNLTNATIISAVLTVHLKGDWSGNQTLFVRRVTEEWKEGSINFDNEPDTTATGAASVAVNNGTDKQAVNVDITSIVQFWANNERQVFGLRLHVDATTLRRIVSSEGVQRKNRPTLALEWATPPDPPTDLRPNGEGKAISDAAPLLMWESEQPFQTRIQIDDDEDVGSSPVWDSGWVANDETAYDTALDGSPPSLTNNTTYWWRVNIRDENGVESGWSVAAEFDRRTKGTLTITEPTNDNDDVETTTPLIEHTFSGRTQSEVRYELFEDDVSVYVRRRFPQTDLQFELPPGYVRAPDSNYRIKVQVWDTLRRMSMGDDKAAVTAERIFQFAPTSGVTAPANFTAVDQGAHVHLEWTRASAPDYFALKVDGVFQYDRLEPSELFVTGTTYAFDFYKYKAGVQQSYAVEAVVNTAGVMKHSISNPTLNHTTNITGIWLVDLDEGTEVLVRGTDGIGGDLGESGTVYYPLSRRDPVRIRDGIRGWEGTIEGIIAEYKGVSARTYLDNLETLKSLSPDTPIRFIGGWRNMPVQLGEIFVEPQPEKAEHYAVSIVYEQIGEYSVEGF